MPFQYTGPQTTLSGAITSSATTMVVASAAGFPVVPFFCLISAEGSNTAETVCVTHVAGTTFTIQRGAFPTGFAPGASAHGNGATVSQAVFAGPSSPYSAPNQSVTADEKAALDAAYMELNTSNPVLGANVNGIPTSDPKVVGQVWSHAGVLTVSAG